MEGEETGGLGRETGRGCACVCVCDGGGGGCAALGELVISTTHQRAERST